MGWTVRGISAVYHGSIQVELARGNERARLSVFEAGAGPSPPARSGPYAVYYSVKRKNKNTVGDDDVVALAQALAGIVDANRKLEPSGLETFKVDSTTPGRR